MGRTCVGGDRLAIVMLDFAKAVAPGHVVWPVQRVRLRPRNGLPMSIRRLQS